MHLKTIKIERLLINTKMKYRHSKDKIQEHCGVFGAILNWKKLFQKIEAKNLLFYSIPTKSA